MVPGRGDGTVACILPIWFSEHCCGARFISL